MLVDSEVNGILAYKIKKALTLFCQLKSKGQRIDQAQFDLLYDFRDYIIEDLTAIPKSERGCS